MATINFTTRIKISLLMGLCAIVLLSSCISRLSRPAISGVIVDYDKKPVANCQVAEAVTDANGHYYLKEIRYNKFLLSEMMVMEAPPVDVLSAISKAGFISDAITLHNPFGGGQAKGAKLQMDTIFLKRINQQFDINNLLVNNTWNLSYTKNADTVYMVRSGFTDWCKTENCKRFNRDYEALTDNYYHSYRKNLSNGVIRRFIEVNFKSDHSAQLQQIQQYKDTYEGSNKENDTLKTSLKWKLVNKEVLQFQVPKPVEISHDYKVVLVDLYQMMLVK